MRFDCVFTDEIRGMVMADPYSFNDSFPTVEDRRRKSNRRRYLLKQQMYSLTTNKY